MPSTDTALTLEGLVKCYGRFRAVSGVSFSVRPGELYGLLGPNGAGKTTTLRVILGFLAADEGRASVLGVDTRIDPAGCRDCVGYLPGDVRAEPSVTGEAWLAFLGRFHPAIDRSFRDALVKRLDLDLSRRVREYSKGNRQKLGIIAALQTRPRLAVLDEPTSGLDPLVQREFYAILSDLRDRGTAILFSSHVLAEVQQLCDRVGVMREGRLVFERSIEELAREVVRRVEVVFADPVPDASELKLPGVTEVERHGRRYRLYLDGPPDPVIKALARFAVQDVVFERPDVEDLFLKHYRKSE